MLFLDDFLEMLDELPAELRERCAQIREIDMDITKAVDRNRLAIAAFFEHSSTLTLEQRDAQLRLLQEEYRRLRSRAEEKVAMAERMQELLEKYTAHLEREKLHFKCELEADNPGVTEAIEKRFSEYVESMMTLRKERRKRPSSNLGGGPATTSATTVANASAAASRQSSVDRRERSVSQARGGGGPPAKAARTEEGEATQPIRSRKSIANLDELAAPQGRAGRRDSSRATSTTGSLAAVASSPALFPLHSLPPPASPAAAGSGKSASLSPAFPITSPMMEKTDRWTPSAMEGLSGSPYSPAAGIQPGIFSSSFGTTPTTVTPLPSFVGAESRHGRPRKLTPRVQEMFHANLQRSHDRAAAAALHTLRQPPPMPQYVPQEQGELEEEELEPESDDDAEEDQRTWCVCNQKSYGNMVACDNKECPFEWFHYHCVGIDAPPRGKWFCPHCTEHRARRAAS